MKKASNATLRVVLATLMVVLAAPALAGFSGTDVYLPSVSHAPGASGSFWMTTVWVHNPQVEPVNVQFFLLERDQENASPKVYNDTIPGGDTKRYEDAVLTMFGESTPGAIRVVAQSKVLVNSRVYSKPSGGQARDTVGQFFSAVPAGFAIGAGEATALLGVYQTSPQAASEFRYNFGFVETTGATASVLVTAFDETGASKGSKTYALGRREVRQYNITDLLPGVNATNLRLKVEVQSGSAGKVVAFGSGIANKSNDPSTFEMQFSDSLLAGAESGSLTLPFSGHGTSTGSLFYVRQNGAGVAIEAAGTLGTALWAYSTNGLGGDIRSTNDNGLNAVSFASGKSGMYATNSNAGGYAAYGRNLATNAYGYLGGGSNGVYGDNGNSDTTGWAGYFNGRVNVTKSLAAKSFNATGDITSDGKVVGREGLVALNTTASTPALDAAASGANGVAVRGIANIGAQASAITGISTSGYAGYFQGKVHVAGTLSKTSGSFKIDHPLDPANKYLYHSFVESPDMKNVYDGVATLGDDGTATVELPAYFEALNRDSRYQLTCVGGFAPVYVAAEVVANRFEIAGGRPGMRVSWQVTGIRKDAYAEAHRIEVEVVKAADERGTYLHPLEHGMPAELALRPEGQRQD